MWFAGIALSQQNNFVIWAIFCSWQKGQKKLPISIPFCHAWNQLIFRCTDEPRNLFEKVNFESGKRKKSAWRSSYLFCHNVVAGVFIVGRSWRRRRRRRRSQRPWRSFRTSCGRTRYTRLFRQLTKPISEIHSTHDRKKWNRRKKFTYFLTNGTDTLPLTTLCPRFQLPSVSHSLSPSPDAAVFSAPKSSWKATQQVEQRRTADGGPAGPSDLKLLLSLQRKETIEPNQANVFQVFERTLYFLSFFLSLFLSFSLSLFLSLPFSSALLFFLSCFFLFFKGEGVHLHGKEKRKGVCLHAWQELTLPNVLILSPSKLECSSLSVTSILI